MRYRLLFLVFLLIDCSIAEARIGGVSGKVVDETSKPVAFASVLLLRAADSGLVKTELTGSDGAYVMSAVADGEYMVKVTLLGYETYVSDKIAVSLNEIAVAPITLLKTSTELKETTVRAQKPFVEVRADKIVVNVENSIVGAGGSVLDVLSHSPGVIVDQNDNISLKGKQGVNVMINGKTQPMSAADLANLLKSTPSNAVETIELISNPSAKYDAAGTAGIINIKMKKDSKKGLNGSVNTSYSQGVYGSAGEGLNVNYRNKKFNLFASYNHSDRQGFNHLTLHRNFYANDVFSGAYDQDNNFVYRSHNNVATAGMDYNLSKKTVIGFVVNGGSYITDRPGNNFSNVIDSATQLPVSHFTTKSTSRNNHANYAANVNLRHNFDSSGKTLSVDADYASYGGTGHQRYTTAYYEQDGTQSGIPSVLLGELKGITQIRSFKADYVNPLKGNAKFEAGIKTSYVTADNSPTFYDIVNGAIVVNAGKTDRFVYHETINAGYINLSKDWTKWSMQAGLRAEQTIANGYDYATDSSLSRNYVKPFPSLAVQRHVNKDNDLGVTLSRRIERPNYEQLNPFKYYLDPTTYSSGYPYLNPALSYAVELSHTFKQRFITTINYTITSEPITEVIQPSETENKVTVQTTKNLTSLAYYGLSGSYQFQFFKWWGNTTNFNLYYSQYAGDIANTSLNAGKATYDVFTSNNFILPKNWSAELSGFYGAPQLYGYMHVREQWMINTGVQKNLFDKRATIKLSAADIFWHGYPRATSNYSNYKESFVAKRDTRQVMLSLTYRFGKRSVPQSVRHSGGAEDEKKRVGGQAG